jgi:thymidylate synthase
MRNDRQTNRPPPSFWRSRYALGLVVMAAAAAYFLLTEHLAHVFGALPYALLLACLLMHVFMHRGHGSHSHHSRGSDQVPDQPEDSNRGDRREP